MRKYILSVILTTLLGGNAIAQTDSFVSVSDARLYLDGAPYYYIGANFWQAPLLAATHGQDGPQLLRDELDRLHHLGVNNLRILVGADAGSKHVQSVEPVLQPHPGVHVDSLLAGLDLTLSEMGKRHMKAVLYLTNSWDWSGGYGFYLRATGHGDSPRADGDGWNDYVRYATHFANDAKAQQLYLDHVRAIVSRTNRYTGTPYATDPTIMSWQICNEPRSFGRDSLSKERFAQWLFTTAQTIKQIDPNHLVSTGSEGLYGCEVDSTLCARIHSHPLIDYLTIHIWPVNWRWARKDHLLEDLPQVYKEAGWYLTLHQQMAHAIHKPLVVEEFGYPRDGHSYSPQATTRARQAFYTWLFRHLTESARTGGHLSGCNFWGWAGTSQPIHQRWQPGDPYLSDPPHEPQGWYSVFSTDRPMLRLLRRTARRLRTLKIETRPKDS